MKKTKRGPILALMFQETSVTIAQVHTGRKKHGPGQVATFTLPAALSAETAEPLGQSLRSFLRTKRLSAKTAVAGIPAKWVVGKPIQIPPTAPENVTSLLTIQAERAFAIHPDDLVVDYCAQISARESSRVLLVAMQRSRLREIETHIRSAGLQLVSVTPTAAATSLFSPAAGHRHCGIYAQNQHCDYVLCGEGLMRDIKHIPAQLRDLQFNRLSPDLNRQLLMAGQHQGASVPLDIVLWPDHAQNTENLDLLRQSAGPEGRVREGREALLEAGYVCSDQIEPIYDAAIGLALTQARSDLATIDFLNPRMAIKPTRSHARAIVWSIVLCLVLIGLGGSVYWGYHQDQVAVATFRQTLQQNEDAYTEAQAVQQKISQASAWYGHRPVYLACLRELTRAFPERGDIWVRSLSLEADGSGVITGDAVDRASVNGVIDKLIKSDAFTQIENLHQTSISGESRNITYAIRFQYLK